VFLLVAVVLLGKGLLFGAVTRLFGYRNIVPVAAALTMGQIGEFSFLMAQLGRKAEAIGEHLHALVISTAVMTMILTPYLARLAGPIYGWRRQHQQASAQFPSGGVEECIRPVVIAGAGRVGRQVARVLARHDIDFVLIEFDQRRWLRARGDGWPVVFGDAAQDPVLRAAGIDRARLALITVPAAVDSWAVAKRIRALAPQVPLVVRADSLQGVEDLLALGALDVVQPEFEAGLEMVREALLELGVNESAVVRSLLEERKVRFPRRRSAVEN
jgi:CPA2 family monovalent cation:H+ antiporter-2